MRARLSRLLHPAFLTALAVLVVNDQVLEVAVPSTTTGKLSDVAGPIVLPVLLSVVWTRTQRGAWLVHTAVGAAFAAIQWVPTEVVVGWGARAGIALVHTPDPTDLVALAVAPLGVRVATSERAAREGRLGRALSPVAATLALAAVLATSIPPPEVLTRDASFRASAGPSALAELERQLDSIGVTDLDVGSSRDLALLYARRDRGPDSLAWQQEVDSLTARYDRQTAEARALGYGRYRAAVPLTPAPVPVATVELSSRWDPRTRLVWVSALDPAQPDRPAGFPMRGTDRESAFRALVRARVLLPLQDPESAGRRDVALAERAHKRYISAWTSAPAGRSNAAPGVPGANATSVSVPRAFGWPVAEANDRNPRWSVTPPMVWAPS